MSKIQSAFEKNKAFIPFITCGDPDLNTTEEVLHACAANGADLIELGIPFSDPVAEAPVVQGANIRALSAGTTTDRVFELLQRMNGELKVPLVLVIYANVIFSYGSEKFLQNCAKSGVDGILILDLPYEEKEDFHPLCKQYGIEMISQIAPARRERIAQIAREAEGFLYLVSNQGIHEKHEHLVCEIPQIIEVIRENTKIPCAIGFGIETPQDAQRMSKGADGVVCDSALIHIMEEHKDKAAPFVGAYVKSMKEALNQ